MTSCRRAGRAGTIAVLGAALAVGSMGTVAVGAAEPGDERSPRSVDDPAVTSGMAWHLEATDAAFAWRSSLGAGTTVAIVDSGIDAGHPDLVGQVGRSVSCIGAAGDPGGCTTVAGDDAVDGTAHGTHVAGLVAARADDGVGVAGVAPRSKLLIARALGARCAGSACVPVGDTADVAAAVRWSVANGADVVNLSLSAGRRLGPDLAAAVEEAWDAGAIPVLAAGNRSGVIGFGEGPSAVVVTATTRRGDRAPYAPGVDGSSLGVAAPGGLDGDTAQSCHVGAAPDGIVSTSSRRSGDGSGYACLAGTSMAAPQVSGGLALLLSMGFTRDQAVDRLLGTARPGADLGAGEIDLAAATAPPLPPGVVARRVSFGTAPVVEARAASTGPFAPVAVEQGGRVPRWLWILLGGLVAGLAADVAYRLHERWSGQHSAGAPPDR